MAEQRYWNRVDQHGNPYEEGTYDVIMIYPRKDKNCKVASRERRYFGRMSPRMDGMSMEGQSDHGYIWYIEANSHLGERVFAWLPKRDFPEAPDLPEDCIWEDEI